MKRISKYALAAALIFMLTGCFPTGERSAERSNDDNDSVWAEAAKIDNFALSLTLPQDYPSELPEITAAVKRWDKDTVINALCNGKTIISEKEYKSDRYPEEKRTVLLIDDEGSYISFEPESIGCYCAAQNDKYHYKYLFSTYEVYYDNPDISYVSELEGFSKDNAVKRVRELAEKLGITNLGEANVFGVTAESANDFFDKEQEYNNDYTEWTKEDEAYFITFPLTYEEIPLETVRVAVPGYSYDGSYIKAIVTKNDIIDFSCAGITEPEYVIGDAVKINFSAEDILSKIVSAYSQRVLTDKLEFYNCELTYAPVDKLSNNDWVFAPIWRFDYALSGEYEIDNKKIELSARYSEMYSAETGNRIAYEWQN